MKNKAVLLGLMMFLLTGAAGFKMFWTDRTMPPRDNSSFIVEKSEQGSTQAFNNKEGWGFVKSVDGRKPQVTQHQLTLVRSYNALFMGRQDKKNVTLTFDMGYEKEGMTPRILDILKRNNIRASFFVTTYWIEKNPELARRVVKEGHLLGNHTVRHKSLPTLPDEEVRQEIEGWEEVAKGVVNYKTQFKYMRPPMGEYSERTLKITKELGYRTAFWSVAIKDWLPMGGSEIAVRGIVSQLHNGAVILLHGNSEDVVGGLEQIINQIKGDGYKIVPIHQI